MSTNNFGRPGSFSSVSVNYENDPIELVAGEAVREALTSTTGASYNSLKERLDASDIEVDQKAKQTDFDGLTVQVSESENDNSYTLGFLNGLNSIRTRSIIAVNGFYSVDDEDAYGKYRVLAVTGTETWTDVKDASNNTIFQMSATGNIRAVGASKKLRVIGKAGSYNVKLFGVKGDGVANDSTNFINLINAARQNAINNGLKKIYSFTVPTGTYILDKEIKMSPYIKFKSKGNVTFQLTFNGTAFWIAPTSGDPTYAQSGATYYLNKNVWNRGDYFDGTNGGFVFTTTLDKASTGNNTCAIELGDRSASSNSGTPISRYTIQNVNAFALNAAFKWNGVNHYIGTYKNCHLEGNNHAVWLVSYSTGNALNAGENFNFENCVIAQQAQEAVLLECAGHDISFTDCSFDFNASPVIRSKYSGTSIRVNNCYLEMIGDGTGDEIFYQSENTITGTDYRRNSLYTKNFIMYIKRPSQIIKNIANASGSFINLFLDLEIEMRYAETDVTYPYNLQDRFLFDTGQNITVFKHRIVNTVLRRNLVSKDLNLLSNGDFSRSTLNADLTVNASDPYWFIGYKSATSNPTIVAEGVGGTNCLKWTVTTAGNNSIQLNYLFKIPVEAGEQLQFSSIFRTDKIDNNAQFIYRFEFYDANNVLLTTTNYYDFVTGTTGIQTIDSTQFRLSRSTGIAQVPNGATQVKPILIPANHQGTTMWLDDIHFSKSK